MKLDANVFRYLTKEEFRVLTAVEMGMKNHELVSHVLIESIAGMTRGGCHKVICMLMKHKLLVHENKRYDGYKLTYNGYDFLALRTLVKRGHIIGVGTRVGVGKESDIHIAEGPNGETLALKLHRLGRISFRSIKQNRDYLQHRQSASWMYMARLAAIKEFAYMRALHGDGFPTPQPIDQNRHVVLMSFVKAKMLLHVRSFPHPFRLMEKLFRLLVRFAQAGLIHGDFNEFNLMLGEEEQLTVIDFPQIVSTSHPNAEMYFDRDVECVKTFFKRKCNVECTNWPRFRDVVQETEEGDMPRGAKSGYAMPSKPHRIEVKVPELSSKDDALLVACALATGKHAEPDLEEDDVTEDGDSDQGEEQASSEREDEEEGSPTIAVSQSACSQESGAATTESERGGLGGAPPGKGSFVRVQMMPQDEYHEEEEEEKEMELREAAARAEQSAADGPSQGGGETAAPPFEKPDIFPGDDGLGKCTGGYAAAGSVGIKASPVPLKRQAKAVTIKEEAANEAKMDSSDEGDRSSEDDANEGDEENGGDEVENRPKNLNQHHVLRPRRTRTTTADAAKKALKQKEKKPTAGRNHQKNKELRKARADCKDAANDWKAAGAY